MATPQPSIWDYESRLQLDVMRVHYDPQLPWVDDFRPRPKKPKGPFQIWPSLSFAKPVFWISLLIVLTTFIDLNLLPFDLSVSQRQIFERHDYWRLLTALGAHSGIAHLASNLTIFLFFGWMLFAYFGVWAFPVLPLIIGLLSNLATVSLYGPHVSLLGASGMIYGMEALWLSLYLKFDRENRITTRILRAVGYCLLLLLPNSYEANTSYLAHATGFAFGLLAGLVAVSFLKVRHPRKESSEAFAKTLSHPRRGSFAPG